MSRPNVRCKPLRRAFMAAFLAIFIPGGGIVSAQAGDPVLIGIDGTEYTLGDLRADFELRNAGSKFDATDRQTKLKFLETMGANHLFVQVAKEFLGGLGPGGAERLAQSKGGRLLAALDDRITAPIDSDSLESRRIVRDRLNREVLLLQFASPSDSIAAIARDEVIHGRPFEEVERAYVTEPIRRPKGPELDWMSAAQLGDDLAEDLLLRDRQPGYVTAIRATRRGYEFLRIKEFRPFDLGSHAKAEAQFVGIVRRIRRREALAAYRDSLKKENRLEVDSAASSMLQKVMIAYWDSVTAGAQQPGMRPNPTRPPLWRLDAASGGRRLLRVDGREMTAGAFVKGLADVPSGIWPNAAKLDGFQRQIEFRVLVELRIAEAHRLGLDRQPAYAAGNRYDEEQILRENLQKRLSAEISVTEQDLRDYYELNKEVRYRQYERIRLSYLVFPQESEARAWLSGARAHDYLWWQAEIKRFETDRPEIRSVATSREIDLAQPLAGEERPMVEASVSLNAGDILESPVKIADGWAVVRVVDRQRAGYVPFEKVEGAARTAVSSRKLDERIQSLVGERRSSHRLASYPERL
jgi:hypothetical protein